MPAPSRQRRPLPRSDQGFRQGVSRRTSFAAATSTMQFLCFQRLGCQSNLSWDCGRLSGFRTIVPPLGVFVGWQPYPNSNILAALPLQTVSGLCMSGHADPLAHSKQFLLLPVR